MEVESLFIKRLGPFSVTYCTDLADPLVPNGMEGTNWNTSQRIAFRTELIFQCSDWRAHLGHKNRSDFWDLQPAITSTCRWDKTYSLDVNQYECVGELVYTF